MANKSPTKKEKRKVKKDKNKSKNKATPSTFITKT